MRDLRRTTRPGPRSWFGRGRTGARASSSAWGRTGRARRRLPRRARARSRRSPSRRLRTRLRTPRTSSDPVAAPRAPTSATSASTVLGRRRALRHLRHLRRPPPADGLDVRAPASRTTAASRAAKRVVRYDPVELELAEGPRGEVALLYESLSGAWVARSRAVAPLDEAAAAVPRQRLHRRRGEPRGPAEAWRVGMATRATRATARSGPVRLPGGRGRS